MASKSGMFLDDNARDDLIRSLEVSGHMEAMGNDTGCLICGNDDDHNNLMLCEGCNDEYHIYCLDPPLASVPHDDWYCGKCTAKTTQQKKRKKSDDDGLAGMVSALPREFTSRFGQCVFAYGGFGFGWWPSVVFDPCLTEGSARHTARKNLGKKHLIYFFECHEAPFAVLSSSKIVEWDEGLSENYHLGKTARGAGKQRSLQFQQALQAAIIEEAKPLEQRLDWNRGEEPIIELLPVSTAKKEKKKRKGAKMRSSRKGEKLRRGSGVRDAEDAHTGAKETKEATALFCKVLMRGVGSEAKDEDVTNVGFVKLPSTRKSTFADARKAIVKELVSEALPKDLKWRFHVTTLGPVSLIQEESLGPILPFLRSGMGGNTMNGGSIADPISVVIVETQSQKD